MAPQPMTTERCLALARIAARAAARWEPTWEAPAAMDRHLRILEEHGTARDLLLAHRPRERLMTRFPHLFGGWEREPEPVLTGAEALFFFSVGFALAAGVGLFLSIII